MVLQKAAFSARVFRLRRRRALQFILQVRVAVLALQPVAQRLGRITSANRFPVRARPLASAGDVLYYEPIVRDPVKHLVRLPQIPNAIVAVMSRGSQVTRVTM